ncbi:MAG: prepilin-type N-terminal cleavage/methylation domain-containing protein [Candidatus Pacebacteria bacterium]|nr:prepilin-type N-terminal cleavage/methylation domain-containing protein [Candidatus Paceibacterota bacterium]
MDKIFKTAFTLIELLVVIAIIGILSGLIVVTMNGVTQKANIAKSQVFSNSLRSALMLNLISEWRLEENVNDSWSGGNDGVWYGSSAGANTSANYRPSSECVSGQCLNFDGTDDFINCGTKTSLDIVDEFTLSAWIKASVLKSERILYHYGPVANRGYYLSVNDSGIMHGAVWGTSLRTIAGSKKITNGSWHHTVITRNNSGVVSLYVDASLDATPISGAGGTLVNEENLYIGQDYVGGARLNGTIDEVRIYGAAVPSSQIKEQYYAGLNNLLSSGNISNAEYQSRLSTISKK